MEGFHIKYASRIIRDFARENGISMRNATFQIVGKRVIIRDANHQVEIPDIDFYREHIRMYPPIRH